MKELHINTIGCQMNVYDSERIANSVHHLGYRLTDSPNQADLIIVNTCAIREKAVQKVFSYLGRVAGLKQERPDMIIAVGGCVAQQEGAQILQRAPYVDLVFGTHAIGRLPLLIDKISKKRSRLVDIEMGTQIEEPDEIVVVQGESEVSRFVTIMQGCDNFCTYCVVPYVRGRESSRQPEKIIAEIRGLVEGGVREVTLLGQNVNSYGKKEGLPEFTHLLEKINAIRGLERIRFTTSHPKDLSNALVAAFGRLEKLCHHIHLPVQSGSDRILKKMNRNYTRAQYLDKINQLREACPDIAITSDIIVGFPGETREDFAATLSLIETVGFDSLFAFKYSDRPNAPATRFAHKVNEGDQKVRLQKVLELQKNITIDKNRALVEQTMEILVESYRMKPGIPAGGREPDSDTIPATDPGQWTGRTATNKIVHMPGDGAQFDKGSMIQVTIKKAFAHSLWGLPDDPGTRTVRGPKGESSHAA
ncbi:MAG: tRNA (N6-isopentenyl adenosine(37)-C2)-methylthiotransferase MiaB [Desulfobacterales bacterium]|nr:tRNA (N6-isopentenyl adenosine(37)-C2)-methylthiotransferase MiaB [Desulfobacterales bacterium]